MIKSKKGSMFLVLFFAAIILGIFLLISVQRQELYKSQLETGSEQGMRDLLISYGDIIKEYGYLAARHAATRAAFFRVKWGVKGPENMYWILWGEKEAPDQPYCKERIETLGTRFFDDYRQDIKGTQFGPIVLVYEGNVTNMTITETGPRYFKVWVNGTKPFVLVNQENGEKIFGYHNYTTEVYPVRYFHITDTLRAWVTDQTLDKKVCGVMEPRQGKCNNEIYHEIPQITKEDVKAAVDAAFNDLYGRLEPQFTCGFIYTDSTDPADPYPVVMETDTNVYNHCNGCSVPCDPDPCDPNPCSDPALPDCIPHCDPICLIPSGCEEWIKGSSNCVTGTWNTKVKPSKSKIGAIFGPESVQYVFFKEPSIDIDNQNQGCFSFGEKHKAGFEVRFWCTDDTFLSPVKKDSFDHLFFETYFHVVINHYVPAPPLVVAPDGDCWHHCWHECADLP